MLRMPLSWAPRMWTQRFSRESTSLVALLVLAAVVRLPLMSFPGYYHDLGSYVLWGNALVTHGFGGIYAVKASGPSFPGVDVPGGVVFASVNYPPGTPYLFGGLVLLYDLTLRPFTHVPLTDLVGSYGIGPFFAKLLALVADLAATTLLYREARKRHSQRFAWFAAASYALAPAVLYDGVVWGQTDGLVILPVLVGVFAILSRRYSLAGVSLALAVVIKAQSLIFIPLVALYLWRWARREDVFRFAATLLGTTLLALLPVMVPRFQLFDLLFNMRVMSYNAHFGISRDAFNFWWLMRLNSRSMDSSLFGVNIGLVADALFVAVTIIIGVKIWLHRHPAYLCFGLAMEAFGFFMFMGGQLERYLFPFIPLMLATLICSEWKASDRLKILYVSGAALCLLNMMATVGAFLAGFSPMIPYVTFPPLERFIAVYFGAVAFALAGYLVATFGYAMWVYLAGGFAPLALESDADSQVEAREALVASVSTS